jgi:type VI protein secretion system component Hcp
MGVAALDAYLVFDTDGDLVTPEGETYDSTLGKIGAMQLVSFSLSSQVELGDEDLGSTSGSDPASVKTPFFKLKVTKDIDWASPDIFCGHCQQKANKKLIFDKAKLIVRKHGPQKPVPYLVMEMQRVVIESYKLEASDGDELPDEDITLTFGSMRIVYYPQASDGLVGRPQQPGGWDFRSHKSIR